MRRVKQYKQIRIPPDTEIFLESITLSHDGSVYSTFQKVVPLPIPCLFVSKIFGILDLEECKGMSALRRYTEKEVNIWDAIFFK